MKRYRMIILPVNLSKRLTDYVNSFLEKFNGETIGIVNMQTTFEEDKRFVYIWYWIKTEYLNINDLINYIENDDNFPCFRSESVKTYSI